MTREVSETYAEVSKLDGRQGAFYGSGADDGRRGGLSEAKSMVGGAPTGLDVLLHGEITINPEKELTNNSTNRREIVLEHCPNC